MKYQKIKNLSDSQFRRVTGVKRTTFTRMVEILIEAQTKKKSKGGRPNKLCMEDRLLMALEYIREYRTYLHIATSYGISESNTYETIKWIENTLIKHPEFRLPGKKALLKSDHEFEIILIDATETPIERPKKTKKVLFGQKEKTHFKDSSYGKQDYWCNYLYRLCKWQKT